MPQEGKSASYYVIAAILLIHLYSVVMFIEQEWVLNSMALLEAGLFAVLYKTPGGDEKLALALLYIYVLIVDSFGPNVPMMWAVLEWTVIVCIIYSIKQMPRIRSEQIGANVGVAFYYGTDTPWIARLASLVGLPARSIAIVIGDRAMVPKNDRIECRKASSLKNWVILDTGKPPTDMILYWFNELDGMEIERLGCVKSMEPAIEQIGFQSAPTPGGCMTNLMAWR